MRRPSARLTAVAAGIVVLLLGGTALAGYLYDRTRQSTIAKGVRIAGIDVGGLSAGAAGARLREMLLPRLERPVRLDYRARTFTVPAEGALAVDLDRMLADALARSRSGNLIHRVLRDIRGRHVDAHVPLVTSVAPEAIQAAVGRIDAEVRRPAVSALVKANATGLTRVPSKNGIAVRAWLLQRVLAARLRDPGSDRELALPTRVVRPAVSSSELPKKYPVYLTVSRERFELRLWRGLKLRKVYRIAVGRQGLETPAGTYTIYDKQVNPSWHVPKSPWAGKLAGRVIPPGPADPIKARWLGFYNGAGIHGTTDIGSLGSAASHGCIRMTVTDVIDLYNQVPYGTPIYVG
jgi:L,D-transpeptidase-like protein